MIGRFAVAKSKVLDRDGQTLKRVFLQKLIPRNESMIVGTCSRCLAIRESLLELLGIFS